MAFIYCLFLQNTPSQMLDRVLIMPLDYLSCFAVVLRGIHQKIDICQTYIRSKLRIFPYSGVTHVSATFKLKKRKSTIEFDIFVLCFIFFVPLSQTIGVINRNDTCQFLHASKQWCMCRRVHVQSQASNEENIQTTISKFCQIFRQQQMLNLNPSLPINN